VTRRNEVLQRLRSLLASEKYPPGRRLPPERDLADDMDVSRGALRRALAILEGEGLVWRHVGKGTFVGQRPEAPAGASLVGPNQQNAESVLEVRSILEPAVARLAAERASSTDFARMRSHLAAAKNSRNTETFNLHCDMLHRSIARATHNAILLRLYDALSPIRSLAHAVGTNIELTHSEMAMYWREHADIIDAITGGDAGGAETAMRKHLRHVWDDTPETEWREVSQVEGAAAARTVALELALFRPTLLSLVERFSETAFLAVLRDRDVEIVDAALPRSRGRISMHPGLGPRPLSACAAARAIFAFQSDDWLNAVVDGAASATEDRQRVWREIRETRRRGFARSDEELGAGIYGLAVPIHLNHGPVRFCIGLFGAKSHMSGLSDEAYVEGITQAIESNVGRLGDILSALGPYLSAGELDSHSGRTNR